MKDDGISTAYLKGEVARTEISVISDGAQATVWLGETKGTYKGMLSDRNWVLRLHVPKGVAFGTVLVDGNPCSFHHRNSSGRSKFLSRTEPLPKRGTSSTIRAAIDIGSSRAHRQIGA